jgi:hypothetical protein
MFDPRKDRQIRAFFKLFGLDPKCLREITIACDLASHGTIKINVTRTESRWPYVEALELLEPDASLANDAA